MSYGQFKQINDFTQHIDPAILAPHSKRSNVQISCITKT